MPFKSLDNERAEVTNFLNSVETANVVGTTFTAAGLALMDDANAAAQRTTLGLGTAATSAATAFQSATLGEPTLFRVLAVDVAGQNINTVQPWFPTLGGVTLSIGTYLFEGALLLTSGVTSHSVGIDFAGTATKVGRFNALGTKFAVGTAGTAQTTNSDVGALATNRTVTPADTAAPSQIFVRGLARVSAAGTFIPEFTYSAAPGSSLILANTSFALWRWDATGIDVAKGTWA